MLYQKYARAIGEERRLICHCVSYCPVYNRSILDLLELTFEKQAPA